MRNIGRVCTSISNIHVSFAKNLSKKTSVRQFCLVISRWVIKVFVEVFPLTTGVCMCACERACMRARVRVCMCVCACLLCVYVVFVCFSVIFVYLFICHRNSMTKSVSWFPSPWFCLIKGLLHVTAMLNQSCIKISLHNFHTSVWSSAFDLTYYYANLNINKCEIEVSGQAYCHEYLVTVRRDWLIYMTFLQLLIKQLLMLNNKLNKNEIWIMEGRSKPRRR